MPGLHATEIRAARVRLAGLDKALARAHAETPEFPWRTWAGGFAGLVRVIVGQQVSIASAAALWARLEGGLGGQVSADGVLARDLQSLRALGLSLPKARYVLALAAAERAGAIHFEELCSLDDAAALSALTGLMGVGRWTAEVYLTFCEGRSDFFPAGDLALQEALRLADRSLPRLDEKQLQARAEAWSPYRGVAAHLLWAYYRGVKRGEIDPGRACG